MQRTVSLSEGQWKKYQPQSKKSLDSEDHQKIRSLTHLIWTKDFNKNILDILKIHNFDQRFIKFSPEDQGEDEEENVQTIAFEKIIEMFKKYHWANKFPNFCYFDEVTLIARSQCEVQFQLKEVEKNVGPITGIHFEFHFDIYNKNTQKKISFQFDLPKSVSELDLYVTEFSLYGFPSAPFALVQQKQDLKEGDQLQQLLVTLDLTDLENLEIFDMNFKTEVVYTIRTVEIEQNGYKYIQKWAMTSTLNDESFDLFSENQLFVKIPFLKNNSYLISETIKP